MGARTGPFALFRISWIAAICLSLWGGAVGCNRQAESVDSDAGASSEAPRRKELTDPEEILRKMVAAYRDASSYRDEGVFRAVLRRGEETTDDAAPMAVTWSQPNLLTVRAYQAAVVSDGLTLQAKILDEPSRDLDGQVVSRPVGERLTLNDIFSDAVLRESLGGRLGLHPMQLELLLAENPLTAFFDSQAIKRLLRDEEFDGRACYRVVVNLEGRYVFWIDRENFVLRKFEYPGDSLLDPDEAQDVELTIVAEFPNARFNAAAPKEHFTFDRLDITLPQQAKQVRFFVVPPAPLPTEMFGKHPTGFAFDTLDGGRITPETLQGKIAVLAWFSNHPGSRACIEALDEVRRGLADDERIVFYAVCTEPSSIANDELRQLAREWNVQTPVVRDLGAHGRDIFDIRVAPSLVVLDAKGAVQIHESAANPQLASLVKDQLAELLRRLTEGEDFAAAILTQAKAEQDAYQANLRAASDASTATFQPAEIAPRTEPQHVSLSALWTNEEFAQPGNLLLVRDGEAGRLLALDGERTVVELDENGQAVRRIELDLPEKAAVSYLRTATDGAGKRYYAASSPLAPQTHLFDGAWRRIVSYPPTEQEHAGVRDVLLVDLDESGAPTLAVGFADAIGVHGVNLQGERLWSNREMAPVLSLAATPSDVVGWRKLLVAGNTGHLLRINHQGIANPPIYVKQRAIHHLIAADWGSDRQTTYLGLSYTPEGSILAMGLNANFEEMWSYRLPPGAHANPIQLATPCRLFGDEGGEWLLAGPDGSVHLVSDDGEFFDYFQTGEKLNGLTAFSTGERNVLVIATDAAVTAWNVERRTP